MALRLKPLVHAVFFCWFHYSLAPEEIIMAISTWSEPLPTDSKFNSVEVPKDFESLDHSDEEWFLEEDPPLESDWHVAVVWLLIGLLRDYWAGHDDIYVSGNTVVHFDPAQRQGRVFRAPDLYVVKGVQNKGFRDSWTVWEEEAQARLAAEVEIARLKALLTKLE
jgi:hypothetical protein